MAYLPKDKETVYRMIAELRQYIDTTQSEPTDNNFNWLKNLIHELTTAVAVL